MKKLIILSLILAAGLTAFPQGNRSSREAKSSKSKSSQVASRSGSGSKSNQVKSTSSNQSRSKATSARSSSSRSAASRSSNSRNNDKSSAVRSYSSRSSSGQSGSSAVKSGSSRSGSSGAVRSGNNSSRSSGAVRSSTGSSRSSGAVRSSTNSSRSSGAVRSSRSGAGSSGDIKSGNQASRSYGNVRSGNSSGSSRSSVGVSSSSRSKSYSGSSVGQRSARSSGSATGDSFNRSNRQGNKVYVRNDGNEFRHQNDDVFARTRYRVDYSDVNDLRRSSDFIRVKNHYHNWYSHRPIRSVVVHNHFYRPLPLHIRVERYPYRRPVHLDLCWTPYLHNRFVYYYPLHSRWNIHYGDYIETASSYEAANYAGTVKRIYGRVEEVYYSPEDRTYTLYFGAQFPYHDFSVVVPRDVAKSFSWSPSWYFEDEHVWVVGLIEMWEGKPEIVIHDEQQIRRY